MPRDRRLYMTFPIDFWQHPKIAPLSDAAFRAFVEINGYSRMQDLDGRVPVATAKRMWKPRAITELLRNHPERPSLSVDGDDYLIWNYSEHQLTRADREAISTTNAANGRLGGRPRKNPNVTESVIARNRTRTEPEPNQNQSQSQSQRTDITYVSEVSHEGEVVAEWTDQEKSQARIAGITNLDTVHDALTECCGPMSASAAVILSKAICARSKNPVKRVDGYVLRAVENSPDDVRWEFERLDLGATA